MTYEEKVQRLWRYRQALRRERLLKEELRQEKGREEGSEGEAAKSIARAEDELQEGIMRCSAARREIAVLIEGVPDLYDREILTRRYILGQQWGKIARCMFMDERHIRRRAKRAVEEMETGGE